MITPTVSVIVPVYNTETYIAECIESVIAQTFTDWELILVNDGSTDRSGAICDEYATRDPRIRIIHQPNAGVSAARNTGLDSAKGEWITFLDADDYASELLLQNLYQHANVHNADFVSCDFNFFFPDKHLEENIRYNWDSQNASLTDYIITERWTCIWGCLFKREIVCNHNLMFPIGVRFCEDIFFIIRLIYFSEKRSHVNIPLYTYRQHNSSLLHTMPPGVLEEALISFDHNIKYFEKFANCDNIVKALKYRCIGFSLRLVFQPEDWNLFVKYNHDKRAYILNNPCKLFGRTAKILGWLITHNRLRTAQLFLKLTIFCNRALPPNNPPR